MAGALPSPPTWIGSVPEGGNNFTSTSAPGMSGIPAWYALPGAMGSNPVQIQGTGGYVSPSAQFISGMQAGQQMFSNNVKNRLMGQMSQQYQRALTAQRNAQDAATGGSGNVSNPSPLSNAASAVASGAKGAWNYLQNIPGVGAAARGIGTAASDASQFLERFQDGGPVGYPASSQGMGIAPSHPAQPGISGYADGGPVAAPAPAAAPPAGAIPAAPAAPAAPPPQVSPQQVMAQHVNDYGMMLHGSMLNDQGVPNSAAGAAAIPNAPGAGPAAAHSMTPDFWDQTDAAARKAADAAVGSGMDPTQVYGNLIATRNSFYQGEVLKYLSGAHTALMAADQDGVEKSLRNLYYYLPDGRDLQLKRGADGKIQYQDPIHPVDEKGNPNYVDVTADHLQLLGQAALHPDTVANTMLQYRMIPFNMKQIEIQNQAKLLTGQGTAARGAGIEKAGEADLQKAAVTRARLPYENMLTQATADRQLVMAQTQKMLGSMLQGTKLDTQTAANVAAADKAADAAYLGPPSQVPATDASGNPNLSAAAGKVIHDTGKADPALASMTGADYAQYKSVVASLAATGMPPQMAVQLGIQTYQLRNATHPAAEDRSGFARGGKGPVKDVIPDAKRGLLWVWNTKAKSWMHYPMLPQGASMYGQGISAYRTALLNALSSQNSGGAIPVPQTAPAGAPSAIASDMSPYADDNTP